MSESLFRREALEAKRGSWLGGISLAQSLPLWVMTAFATGAALVVGLFLTLGSYTRRSTVVGQLVPTRGLATVLAPATGVVTELDSAEGKRVRAGQSLAVVSMPRATVNEGDTAAAMAQRLARRQQGLQDAHRAQSQRAERNARLRRAQRLRFVRVEAPPVHLEPGPPEQPARGRFRVGRRGRAIAHRQPAGRQQAQPRA